jgi:hypothetical protein
MQCTDTGYRKEFSLDTDTGKLAQVKNSVFQS